MSCSAHPDDPCCGVLLPAGLMAMDSGHGGLSIELAGRLDSVLSESRRRGFLGSAGIEKHIANARGFSELIEPEGIVLDLGAGGGVPGLPLAVLRPDLQIRLLDSSRRRIRFLEAALSSLEEVDSQVRRRVQTLWGRAEELARDERFNAAFDVVVARSFGKPAVTAECARPFARPGGSLIVSEPPHEDAERWPSGPLAEMAWGPASTKRIVENGYMICRAEGECPAGIPRRAGLAAKRPAF